MKKPILVRWIGVLVVILLAEAARAQPTVTFVNYSAGRAAWHWNPSELSVE